MRRSLLLLLCAAVPAAAKPGVSKSARAEKTPKQIDSPGPAGARSSPDEGERRKIDSPGPAGARSSPDKGERRKIDAKPVLDKLLVFRDDLGAVYVVPAPDSFAELSDAAQWVFYGDDKALYQQRIISSGAQSGKHYSWGMWSPRAKVSMALLGPIKGKIGVTCSRNSDRTLTQLKGDEAKSLLSGATFYEPLWKRQAKFLARDENGTYYYVDELREDYGGNGHRVYVGLKGNMKELPMTNVVSDSAGDIYATKSGQLKIIADIGAAYWIKGKKRRLLTRLEVSDNRYLIYRDLGIYGKLGAICDDL